MRTVAVVLFLTMLTTTPTYARTACGLSVDPEFAYMNKACEPKTPRAFLTQAKQIGAKTTQCRINNKLIMGLA
jgi:hypothetical protein